MPSGSMPEGESPFFNVIPLQGDACAVIEVQSGALVVLSIMHPIGNTTTIFDRREARQTAAALITASQAIKED
jgi:hypothetical protein